MPVAGDDGTLEDALDVVAGFAEGDALDPVDRIDSRVTRIAVMLDPVSRAAWPGVVGAQRQDVGAAELTQQLLEIRLAEPGVVVGVLAHTVLADRQAQSLRDMAHGRGHEMHDTEGATGAAGLRIELAFLPHDRRHPRPLRRRAH